MSVEILVVVVAAVALFELIEHVIIPVAVAIAARKRRAATGAEGMAGKVGRVLSWRGSEGQVLVDGEIWRAESRDTVAANDVVTVLAVQGLRLEVRRTSLEERS